MGGQRTGTWEVRSSHPRCGSQCVCHTHIRTRCHRRAHLVIRPLNLAWRGVACHAQDLVQVLLRPRRRGEHDEEGEEGAHGGHRRRSKRQTERRRPTYRVVPPRLRIGLCASRVHSPAFACRYTLRNVEPSERWGRSRELVQDPISKSDRLSLCYCTVDLTYRCTLSSGLTP